MNLENDDELRIVRIFDENGNYIEVPFKNLKKGMHFNIYEPGQIAPFAVNLIAACDAFLGPHGPENKEVWCVHVEGRQDVV